MARSRTGGPPQLSLFDEPPPLSPPDGPNHLFLGLQPDAAAVAGIRSMTERLRRTRNLRAPLRESVLHVTLAYLGGFIEVPKDRVEIAQQVTRVQRCPPFEVTLNRVMTFPDPIRKAAGDKMALVLCREEGDRCSALDSLRSQLVRGLRRQGIFETEDRGFRPHVTLLYDFENIEMMEVEPISWTVREFLLVYSLSGQTTHRVLTRYPLQ